MPAARKPTSHSAVLALPSRAPIALPLSRLLPSGRSLVVAFAIVALTVGAYVAARTTSMFAVNQIDVTGARPSVLARVEAALTPIEGTSLVSLDAAAIDRRLEGLPDVRLVSYDRAFPHTAKIVVSAERPVAVLRKGPQAWLVTDRGRVLEQLDDPSGWSLPRIWIADAAVPGNGDVLDADEGLAPALLLGRVLSADRGLFQRVKEARAVEGQLVLVLGTGTEIRLGAGDDLALKLAVASRVLDQIGADPQYVDVSVSERAVVK
ncbi:MAG TPA: cell division protein FtsQ/DivIB [Gaiellaceae bacterium]|nr:cell division protein FtsQ/DivIB [Gaiellaceae bacterium]